jgi:hypothetical protein
MYADTLSRPAIFAYTPEVGNTFWPDPGLILPIAEENLRANYLMAWYAGGYPEVSTTTYSEQEPAGNGHIDPGELFGIGVTLVNMGQSTAEGVHVTLVSTSPNVEMQCCPLPLITSIAPGDSAQFGGFQARLAPGTPLGDLQGLSAEIHSGTDLLGTFPLRPIRVGTPVVAFEDPATTMAAWTATGAWDLTSTAWSPPSSFTDSPDGNYPPNATATLTLTSPLDLSAAAGATLRFRSRWIIQPDFDFAQVLASSNGTIWTPLDGRYTVPGSGSGAQPAGQPGLEGTNLAWPVEEMDLSAFAGAPTVYLRFALRSNGSIQRDGWWVDDIVVERLVDGGTTAAEPPAGDQALALAGPAPNPATDEVRLWFTVGAVADVTLAVYDALGRRVVTLVEARTQAGTHEAVWDGDGPDGPVAAGVYLVRLEAAGQSLAKRMTIVR